MRSFLIELYPDIVSAVAGDDIAIGAYKLSRATTQTLLNLSLISHAFHQVAQRALWSSVSVHNAEEIHKLLECAEHCDTDPFRHLCRAYVSLPPDDCKVPPACLLRLIKTFAQRSPALKHFTWDLPFRSCSSKVWRAFNTQMRPLFRTLPLQELVSVQDEVFFELPYGARRPKRAEWQAFPEIEKLALYNPLIDEDLLLALTSMPKLHTVVLMRTDTAFIDDEEIKWFKRVHLACRTQPDGSQRRLRLSISGQPAYNRLAFSMLVRHIAKWEREAPSGFVLSFSIRSDGVPYRVETTATGIYQYRDWVRSLLLNGTFWHGGASPDRLLTTNYD